MTYIESMNCMNCSVEIKRGYELAEGHTNILEQDWEGPTVSIHGGFSSDFDLCSFHGVICPSCLKKAMPNLYKVKTLEKPRHKYHYLPQGVDDYVEKDFSGSMSNQDWLRLRKSFDEDKTSESCGVSGEIKGNEGNSSEVSETAWIDAGEGSQTKNPPWV